MTWLVVGVAGGTCSGKSTLARSMAERLEQRAAAATNEAADHQSKPVPVHSVRIIKQDDYFYKRDRPEHTWIPGWNYINREILGALDMERMCTDVRSILAQTNGGLNVLIVEGFLIFNHPWLRDLCELRFDMYISYEECQRRRLTRNYNPPNPPRYFEEFIWPYYQRHRQEYRRYLRADQLTLLDGEQPMEVVLRVAMQRLDAFAEGKYSR